MSFNHTVTHTVDVAAIALRFEQPADHVLHLYFRAHPQLGLRDRGWIAESLYTLLRHKRSLEVLTDSQDVRLMVLASLCKYQGVSLRELQPLLNAAEETLLKKIKATPVASLPYAAQIEFPDWLIEKLQTTLNQNELSSLAAAMNQPAPLDLRVNTVLAERLAVLNEFAASGIVAVVTPYSHTGIRLKQKIALNSHPLFLSGKIEVQDEGSQILGALLAPKRGEMIVDFCAGAGGKTLMLGAQMRSQGRLYAWDISEKRLANLKPRLKRSGLSNVHPQVLTSEQDTKVKRLQGKIDRVLVDAPCSGLGTLRRNPDLKWRQTPTAINELVSKQKAILRSAARLLKPGGRLVYATCSILPEENEGVVAAFLEEHEAFHLLECGELLAQARVPLKMGAFLHLSPHEHGTDGFFAAAIQRRA